MAAQEVLDEFFRYVQNDIPLRLIFIPEMKLVDRFFVQEHYLSRVAMIAQDDLYKRMVITADKEKVARGLVRKVVEYAILSHRWLPEGEPTFKDMMDGTATGPGLEKLEKFCEVANKNKIHFAWSDTCCIDKTSSSELDEAIRSMFRWYRNSAICITYLAQTHSLDDLERDEWFERGWTLQELLAPRVSKFFNTHWAPLTDMTNDKDGDNRLLIQRLAAASGCPEHQLRFFRPGPDYVDRRMSWAANRKTTRAEDMAYSLMGIFDVTLQPAYGEGGERVFSRLVDVIMQSNGRISVLNWAGKAAELHNSNALPSSHRCYLGHKVTDGSLSRPLDVAMTSRGLRIPLVVLPMRPRSTMNLGSSIRLDLEFSDARFVEQTGVVSVEAQAGRSKEAHVWHRGLCRWALGVFNYVPPDENSFMGHPTLRRGSAAYLLWRRKEIGDQTELHVEEGMIVKQDIQVALGFHEWKKASTAGFVCFDLKSIGNLEVMIVGNNVLEVVYL